MTEAKPKAPKDAGAARAAPRESQAPAKPAKSGKKLAKGAAKEIGGRGGLDPTRYGDWEKAGRAIDF